LFDDGHKPVRHELAGEAPYRELFFVEEAVDFEEIDAVEPLHESSGNVPRSGEIETRKARIAAADGSGNGGFAGEAARVEGEFDRGGDRRYSLARLRRVSR